MSAPPASSRTQAAGLESGTSAAASAEPEPLDDPLGDRAGSHGLRAGPKPDTTPLPIAYSSRLSFPTSTATLRNNALSGVINDRDGGTFTAAGNLENVAPATMRTWFVEPAAGDFRLRDGSALVNLGSAGSGVVDDYCADDRDDGLADIGAIEYDGEQDCITVLDAPFRLFRDGFE